MFSKPDLLIGRWAQSQGSNLTASTAIVAVNNFRNTARETTTTTRKKEDNKLDDIWEFQRVTRQTRICFFLCVCADASSLVYIIREPLLAHLFNDNAQKRQLFKICTKMPENWSNRIARNCLETIPEILSIFIWHFAEDGEDKKKRNMFWFFLFIIPWRGAQPMQSPIRFPLELPKILEIP